MTTGRIWTPPPTWSDVASGLLSSADLSTERWHKNRREKQVPPLGDWFVWLVLAGRGFGKTRTGAEWLHEKAMAGQPGDQVLLAGRTPADVRDYALKGEGGLLTHHSDIEYLPSKRLLMWPNGVEGLIRSGANPEEFRGFSGEVVWLDEFASWQYPQECWDNLIFGVRERDPRICITSTPRPVPVLKEIMAADTTVAVRGSSDENADNLSDKWFKAVLDPLRGTRLGRQEIEAEFLEYSEHALWGREILEDNRVSRDTVNGGAPGSVMLVRVIVGVDPQGTKATGSETGIVAAGKGSDGHYYVIDDGSINGTPGEWGGRSVALLERNNGDRIVGEANFGGDMVEATIRSVRRDVPYKHVRASRGKQQRAEPIAAMYEQGKVHHVGGFPALEDEMCTWSPEENWSPNRVDALVWALTELSTGTAITTRKVMWG